jgi:signal peptidase I
VLVGWRSFTVMSGSMQPAIGTGDLIVDERIPPLHARVGDVVTFKDPASPSRLITHRLRSIHVVGGTARMTTKGDANNTVEHWSVPASGRVGRVLYRLPELGYALALTRGRDARLLLIVLPALLLGGLELRRIWRPARPAAE